MNKKVAIVGLARGWASAPYGDPSWEIWGLNDLYLIKPDHGASRWFELHGDTPLTRARRQPDHFEQIAALNIPVYYLQGHPPAPMAVKYPLEAAIRAGRDYFTCTNAYQIALALHEGFDAIALYGTPLQGNREAVVERPCVSWWLGLAEGRGVTVTVHHKQSVGLLCHPYRYALEDVEEREASFAESWAHASSLLAWLPAEAGRLATARHCE